MKELTCNVLYDKEVGPVEVKCTLINIEDNKNKKNSKVAIVKEESEEFGTHYTIWDYKHWEKAEKEYL